MKTMGLAGEESKMFHRRGRNLGVEGNDFVTGVPMSATYGSTSDDDPASGG